MSIDDPFFHFTPTNSPLLLFPIISLAPPALFEKESILMRCSQKCLFILSWAFFLQSPPPALHDLFSTILLKFHPQIPRAGGAELVSIRYFRGEGMKAN